MSLIMDDGQVTLYQGHVLDVLRELPDESVQCVVTSPPYWALRAYGTEAQVWGGDPDHAHEWSDERPHQVGRTDTGRNFTGGGGNYQVDGPVQVAATGSTCPCGAWRGELGHEPTPQMFVAHLVDVFREVRRVMKPDAVLWVNLGDSYSGSGKGPSSANGLSKQHTNVGSLIGPTPSSRANRPRNGLSGGTQTIDESYGAPASDGLKPKDLVLIPERFALEMQSDGWYVRSRIAWCKRAPMPESIRDRPTSAWEHVWMFTKSARYFWDADAVREEASASSLVRIAQPTFNQQTGGPKDYANGTNANRSARTALENFAANPGANMRNYWLLSPDPEPLAHFATFPREIPRRCIAAATSDKGECPQCGKSWVRVVEHEPMIIARSGRAEQMGQYGKTQASGTMVEPARTITTGWTPQCTCGLDPVPSIVLDPFVGSGTTTMVARSMLRRSIGIDLNEQYLHDIALRKNLQMALMPMAPAR